MATVLKTGPDMEIDSVLQYLAIARQHHTQAEIAKYLEVDVKTIRRWEARQSSPKPYVAHALRQLILPFGTPKSDDAAFKFIDLFAGIGGIRAAFEGIGGQCVFTSEWDSYAQKTYAENFHDGHLIAGDITQVDAASIPDHDVLLAGFPCQPFSIAGVSKKNALGRKHGFHDETQGTLFFDVCRIIDEKRPRAFLLENVKNLMSHDKGRTFDVIRRALTEQLGYHIHHRVIDGAHFTPQHRERIIIVGFREDVAFDINAVPLPAKGCKVMRDILHRTDGSEPLIESDGDKYFDHANASVLTKYTLTDKLWAYLQNYAAKHKAAGNGFGFGLVYPDSVSRTLSARYYKDGSEILVSQGEKKNPRRLTPRECARLMGFPDTYRIPVSDTKAYQQLSQAAVMPMVKAVATLIAPHLTKIEAAPASTFEVPKAMTSRNLWTREQIKLAVHLYCQLPFGKLHGRNPEIIKLAKMIGRTPDAVAMKLTNLASLDPSITGTGRKGLTGKSHLDREVWEEFYADWERLAVECELIRRSLDAEPTPDESGELLVPEEFTGETRQVITEQRIKQSFFRRSVLSSYGDRCCMSGVSEPRLLIASHIVPWSKDKQNRLNPSNGLCLSAIHDRAFDEGLISVSNDFRVLIARALRKSKDPFLQSSLCALEGSFISLPRRFLPSPELLARHRTDVFLGE